MPAGKPKQPNAKPGSKKTGPKKTASKKTGPKPAGRKDAGRRLDTQVRSIQPPSRGGAPLSPTTRWLENEMRKLRDLEDYRVLYDYWLKRYWRSKGQFPRDPKRAFEQAAAGCMNRILRERGRR